MTPKKLLSIAVKALENTKAIDIKVIDVRELTPFTDYMIICSGTSERHVKSLANNVWISAKEKGANVLGIEGEQEGEWVLVDLCDVIVHVMLPRARAFYALEKLWDVSNEKQEIDKPAKTIKKTKTPGKKKPLPKKLSTKKSSIKKHPTKSRK
jgi:ribosome-associated protein